MRLIELLCTGVRISYGNFQIFNVVSSIQFVSVEYYYQQSVSFFVPGSEWLIVI